LSSMLCYKKNKKAWTTKATPASSALLWKKCFQKGTCLRWVHVYGFYGSSTTSCY
jgi:hypothetical protein